MACAAHFIFVLSCVCGLTARAGSVTMEAEFGGLGSDWAVSNSASPVYIAITPNNNGNNAGSLNRAASYSVVFASAGTYQLCARVRVGTNTFNDDSMFYASSFGIKSPTEFRLGPGQCADCSND